MSDSAGIVLRILSGQHMGAEIVLTPGAYTLGSDDSCDIILQDSAMAARHVEILVVALEQGVDRGGEQPAQELAFRVDMHPLDGGVQWDGCETEQGPPAYQVFSLGTTVCVWGRTADGEQAWQRVFDVLDERAAALSLALEGKNAAFAARQSELDQEAAAPQSQAVEAPAHSLAASSDENIAPAGQSAVETTKKGLVASVKKATLIVLVALLLLALMFHYQGKEMDPAEHVQTLNQAIEQAGFSSLEVVAEQHGVLVRGWLRSDAERNELLRLAQAMLFPVHIKVTVRQDRVNAVRAAFNNRGIYPEVSETGGEMGEITVAAYVEDALVEGWAFSTVLEDVPELSARSGRQLHRLIRYARDVDSVLVPALSEAGLEQVLVRYFPGTVEFSGNFTSEQRQRLDTVIEAVQQQLGVPLVTNVVMMASAQDQPKPFRVVGVSMDPLPFVSLGNGETIFEGGNLPGGYVLDAIGIHELTLNKNGHKTKYILRGNP